MRKRFIISSIILTMIFVVSVSFNTMAAEKPKIGGTLRLIHTKTAGKIGVPMNLRGWNHEFIDNTLQTFLYPANDDLGAVDPYLATSYELAADRSHYIIKLRKGVKFHDSTDFNAQAAKWNHDKWVESDSPTFSKIASIEIIDDYTMKYNLISWDAITLQDFSKNTFMISPTAYEKNGEKWADLNPVGTGPFKMVGLKRNTYLKFKKFEDYWGEGPYLDGLDIYTIPDPMTSMAVLKKKEADAWLGVDSISASQAINEGELAYQLFDAIINAIQFNSEDPDSPWSNIKMRKAMEYALDKEAIVQSVTRGLARPAYTILHSIDKFPPGPGTTPRTYDPQKARQLMKEAGYPNGFKAVMKYQANPAAKDTVTAIQAMLSEIGIKLVLEPLAGAKFHEVLFQKPNGSDLLLGNVRGGGGRVLRTSHNNFAEGSIYFQGIKKPDGLQDLIAQAMKLEDREKIFKLLFEAERLAYPFAMFVPVYQNKFAALMQPYVKDAYFFWGGSPYPNLRLTWLDK